MYRGKGNTAATSRRRSQPQPEQLAVYIAESIRARLAEGRGYDLDDYGLADKPEMIEFVARALGVIQWGDSKMYRTLIALVLALLMASAASAQKPAAMPRPKRYDPAEPPRYHWFYHHDSSGHGRHHPHWRHDHGRFDSHPDHHPRRDDGRRYRTGVRRGQAQAGSATPQSAR